MKRIDLLPQRYAEQRRQRRNLGLVVVAGLVALLLLIGWWFMIGLQIGSAQDELAEVEAANARLEAQIAELQRFAALEAEVQAKRQALNTIMAGDVDWPAVLTEIAMVVPGEVWLTNLTASAGQTEGATQVGTETAEVRVSNRQPFGRIQFAGNSLSMPGVAKWMTRLESVKEFFAVYLNNASKAEAAPAGEEGSGGAAVDVVTFDTTLELSNKAASGRFQRGETQ
jgi:Tfp pilus assembly protein PilN